MASFSRRGSYWRAQIRRKGQPLQNATFDTKAQAETWAREIESRMDRGTFFDNGEAERTTLNEALDRYYREISSQKHHPVQELQRIRRWQKHVLAKRFLASLRGADFAKYRDGRREDGKAENTIRLELHLISHLFVIARKEWGMEGLINPVANIRKPGGSRQRDRRLELGEYERIHASLTASSNPYVAPAFDLAIETTLRQGMLFELRWEWVDWARRVIRIPESYRNKGNKGVPVAVPLSSKAMGVLQAMPRAISGKILDCSPNALRVIWDRRMKELAIVDLHWHDLRHEGASILFEKGLEIMAVASITGHTNPATLRRYVHLRAEDLVARLG